MSTVLGGLAILAASSKSKSSSSSASLLILLLVVGVALYFLFLRPQQQKARKQREAKSTVEVGDEIVTVGGLVGRVLEMEGDRVTVEAGAEGETPTQLVFVRSAIARKADPVTTPDAGQDGDGAAGESEAEVDAWYDGKEGEGEERPGSEGAGNGAAPGGSVTGEVEGTADDTGVAGGNGSSGRRRRGRNGTRRTP